MTSFENILSFEGYLTKERNGGFSSTNRKLNIDLIGINRVVLKCKGDGQRYKFTMRSDYS